MKEALKKTVFACLVLFLLIQFYQPARNIDKGQVSSTDFLKYYSAPQNVQNIVKTSCYDCHSNNTKYPVYSYIQPIRFFLEKHIKEGKEQVNFNEWGNYSSRMQRNKLNIIIEQVEKGKMPLDSYTFIHQQAKLSEKEKNELIKWLNSAQQKQ